MDGATQDLVRPWRGIALILASVALALKLIVPAGFMVAPAEAGLPFQVVICTDQGMVLADAGPADGTDRDRPNHADGPCAFAGHAAGLSPPSSPEGAAVVYAGYAEVRPARRADVGPGRGLAAPPPPSRGPPSLLT